jgi:hypothetical protein
MTITRVNNLLWSCSFELDYTTAQIRCKVGYNFKDLELGPQIVENCIYITIETISTYWPGILAIIAQEKTPPQAYSELKLPPDTPPENQQTKQLQEAFIQFFEQDKRHFQSSSSTLIRVTYGGHNKRP